MNIYQKLIEVRKEVPYIQKADKGHQYQYTGSSRVLGSLKNKMDELGLLLIPKVITKELHQSTEEKNGKSVTTYFTELTMTFTWVNAEKPEEQIECPWYGQGIDTAGEKGVGKALTYAEKYFMLKFFNIATDKDDPDSFQAKFEDDKPQSIKPKLEAKWQTLAGNLNEFPEWYKKQFEQGVSEQQMESFLTKKLMEKKKGA